MSQFKKAFIRVGEERINPANVSTWQPEEAGTKTRVFYANHTETNPSHELLDCVPEDFDLLMETAT